MANDVETNPGPDPAHIISSTKIVHGSFHQGAQIFSAMSRGCGMVLAALSMVYAGALEIFRKQNLAETGGIDQILGEKHYNSSTLSMFIQIPQFALIGASEVFASITGLEFAYSQSPPFTKGLMMGLFLVTSGLGSYLLVAIQNIVQAASPVDQPWYSDEINEGYTEYYFFLLAGLMVLNFLIFLVVANFYQYRVVEPDNTPEHENTFDNTILTEKKPPPDILMDNPGFANESTHL